MESLDTVRSLLSHRKREDLSDLLTQASIDFEYVNEGFTMPEGFLTMLVNAVIYAPIPYYDQLRALSEEEARPIWNAVGEVWPNKEGDGEQAIIDREFRLAQDSSTSESGTEDFLNQNFELPGLHELPIDHGISEIIHARIQEAQLCFSNEAHLSVIFLCGSILEGVILGAARREPEKFHRSSVSPKQNGKVKSFDRWSLSEFINVAHDIGLLDLDIQKYSHNLRDFRNYIHPYKQMESGFNPDRHTAAICLQVLKAALASIAGERSQL